MILQFLCEYYDRIQALSPENIATEGWEKKEIHFIVVINKNGELVQIEDTRETIKNKNRAKSFLVPIGKKRASNVLANLLWDNEGYVFGVVSEKKEKTKGKLVKPEKLEKLRLRANEQKTAFINEIKDKVGDLEYIKPLLQFLRTITIEKLMLLSEWEEIYKSNSNFTFRYNDETILICENEKVKDKINQASKEGEENIKNICLITGEKDNIARLHTSIKGVWGGQPGGGNIISFNQPSFESFGKSQGMNSPVGQIAEFKYTTAINMLLSKDSKQRMQVGDASTIFWSDKSSKFESDFTFLFSEPQKDNPSRLTEAVKSLLASIQTGKYYEDNLEDKFYVLGLSPNSSRISIRFWFFDKIKNIVKNIAQHFTDFIIIKSEKEAEYYSIYEILRNISIQNKLENIPPNVAGDFMRSILNNTPYPASIYQAVLRRIRSDSDYRVKPVRAALIKAYLNRYYRVHENQTHKELTMSLDITQPSIGYQLGRLFATLAKIQSESNPNIKATIGDRYYGAACATPVTVFATLLRLKNHHLAKLNKGRVVYFERLLGEILSHLNDFPSHLNLHEQGRFAIGYYHQWNDFFIKKENGEDNKKNSEV